ncbi:MAG: hypothetical protein V2A73_07740, partial [Pseudomonadota bacterium]
MKPRLAYHGKLVAASGALLVTVGALADLWPVVTLGALVISTLCTTCLLFYPTGILLRRQKVELAFWVPFTEQPGGTLTTDHQFWLRMALRNYGAKPLHIRDLYLVAQSALETPPGARIRLPAFSEVLLNFPLRARAAGYLVVHGVAARFDDPAGFFELSAYFPNPLHLKVFPRLRSLEEPHGGRPLLGAL